MNKSIKEEVLKKKLIFKGNVGEVKRLASMLTIEELEELIEVKRNEQKH